jgi:hypothetical protein
VFTRNKNGIFQIFFANNVLSQEVYVDVALFVSYKYIISNQTYFVVSLCTLLDYYTLMGAELKWHPIRVSQAIEVEGGFFASLG